MCVLRSAISYSANQIIPKYNEELMSWQVYILQSKIEKYFWRRIYNRPLLIRWYINKPLTFSKLRIKLHLRDATIVSWIYHCDELLIWYKHILDVTILSLSCFNQIVDCVFGVDILIVLFFILILYKISNSIWCFSLKIYTRIWLFFFVHIVY